MCFLFYGCSSLSYLPDISKWNMSIVTIINKSHMFFDYISLKTLPNISEWAVDNVKNIISIFCHCSLLSYLSDITKWSLKEINVEGFFS